MTRWAPLRQDTMAAVAAEITGMYSGRIAVAVDGIAGSGAAEVADALARALEDAGRPARRVTLDGPGADDPDAEAPAFRPEVLAPFRADAPDGAVLVVDGPFLLRRSLAGAWNWSLWVDVPPAVAEERMREAGAGDDTVERVRDAQSRYRRTASPRRSASAILDNADPEHPRRVFADSC